MRRQAGRFAVAVMMLFAFLSAAAQNETQNTQGENEDGVRVEVRTDDKIGDYLTDAEGRTLYLFLDDLGGAEDSTDEGDVEKMSTCYDACAENWPPFTVQDTPDAGEGVDEELVGITERRDGSKQATYNGWPLYYFAQDEEPGDLNGQGVGEKWSAVSPTGGQAGSEAPEIEDEPDDTSEQGDETADATVIGSFTEVQAENGHGEYQENCVLCHGENLTSGEMGGPPIAGSYFFSRWSGRTVGELFDFIRTNMPYGEGGSLSTETYSEVTAYVLQFNGLPSGEEPLGPDSSVLDNVIGEPDGD